MYNVIRLQRGKDMEKFKNYLLQCKERLLLELQGKELVYNIIDVLAVALLIYIIFAFIKKYNCTRLIKYLVVGTFVSLILSAGFFPLPMLAYLAKFVMLAMLLGFVVLFHSEIKRTLWKLSSPKEAEENYTTIYDVSDQELRHTISEIVRATINMAKKDVGALMLIAPNDVPDSVIDSGTKMDSKLSCPLIECLFNTKAPLHDGAVIVRANRIIAAGCFLPLTQNSDVDKELGTRHRAAIGITEETNVMAIVVSEETGVISVAIRGELERYFDAVSLTDKLEQVYGLKAVTNNQKESKFMRRHR